ncbi:MAG: dihydroorotate dehydrogenase [Patescibacteria group bacterium]|nr:dihydroorotate dehydrogenase [Patescibacteria group bacterium]
MEKLSIKNPSNLRTDFLGVKFPNPVVLASGILGMSASSMASVVRNGAGGVTTKSTNLEGQDGHPGPKVITYESGMLNCYGLTNAGFWHEKKEIAKFKKRLPQNPLIFSIFGFSLKEFQAIAQKVDQTRADFIEINISCPNVQSEHGRPFGCVPGMPQKVIKAVKKLTKKPIIVKLSPNVVDIVEIAREVESAGAHAISAINTLGPGMVINLETRCPVLSAKAGGMSGPAIRPLAVKMIYDIYENVKIPLIGIGGVTTGQDALEMIMAGAQLVEIGSGVYYRGISVFKRVCNEMQEWMRKQGVKSIKEIIGAAHD